MKNIFYIIILLSASVFAQAWQIETTMPKPVSGGRAIVEGDKIYILGGYSDSTQSTVNWIQVYEPNKNEWTFAGNMRQSRVDFVADKYNGSFYYFGGSSIDKESTSGLEGWGGTYTDNAVLLDLDSSLNRVSAEGIINNGIFYVFGGYPQIGSNNILPYIVAYDLNTSTVTYTDTLFYRQGLIPQEQMGVSFYDDVYLFGGIYNGISNEIYRFNVASHDYSQLEIDMLEPRAAGAAVYSEFSDMIYIIGGFNESQPALSSVEVFNPYNSYNSTEYTSELNVGRANLMAVSFEGRIYVFGGIDENGLVVSEVESFFDNEAATDTYESNDIKGFKLYQNYPNPFNPATKIGFEIIEKTFVSLKIYDILGNEIKTLKNEIMNAGNYSILFNAEELPSGIYLYKLTAGSFAQTKKMILVK